jgi:hypothetical protein
MRSGLNIFLLIGAIVTNIVVSQPDDFDQLVGLRDHMLAVIEVCLSKSNPLETTAPRHMNSAFEITIRIDPKTLQTFNDHGNLMDPTSPLAGWVKTTTDLARTISWDPPTVPLLDYSGEANRLAVLGNLAKLRCTLFGHPGKLRLIERLICALESIIGSEKDYKSPKRILESSIEFYQTAEDARADAELAGIGNMPPLFAADEINPQGNCHVI